MRVGRVTYLPTAVGGRTHHFNRTPGRLCHLRQSPVAALTSAGLQREAIPGLTPLQASCPRDLDPQGHRELLAELLRAVAHPEQAVTVLGEERLVLVWRGNVIRAARNAGEDHDVSARLIVSMIMKGFTPLFGIKVFVIMGM